MMYENKVIGLHLLACNINTDTTPVSHRIRYLVRNEKAWSALNGLYTFNSSFTAYRDTPFPFVVDFYYRDSESDIAGLGKCFDPKISAEEAGALTDTIVAAETRVLEHDTIIEALGGDGSTTKVSKYIRELKEALKTVIKEENRTSLDIIVRLWKHGPHELSTENQADIDLLIGLELVVRIASANQATRCALTSKGGDMHQLLLVYGN